MHKKILLILLILIETTINTKAQEKDPKIQNIMPLIEANDNLLENSTSFLFSPLRYQSRAIPYRWQTYKINGAKLNSLNNNTIPYAAIGALYSIASHSKSNTSLFFDYTNNIPSLGNNRSIWIEPQNHKTSGYAISAISSRTYSYRLQSGYRLNKTETNGWAIAIDASRHWGKSMTLNGVWTDNFGLKLAASKKLHKNKGTIQLTTLINPTKRATPWSTVQEAYNLANSNVYNPAWGDINGTQTSTNVRTTYEPIIITNHTIKLHKNIKINSHIATRFGQNTNSSLNWQGAPNPRPDYYKYLPSAHKSQEVKDIIKTAWQNNINIRQIDFTEIAQTNTKQNNDRANYIIEDRVSKPLFLTAGSRVSTENLSLAIRTTYQSEHNYKKINSMLGGKYWLDIDTFVEQDEDVKNKTQNNLQNPNRHVTAGDEFGYNYKLNNLEIELEGAYHKKWNKLSLTAAANISTLSSQREGYYEKENFPGDSSYGASTTLTNYNYALRIEGEYRAGNRLWIGAAIGYNSIAPTPSEIFISPRYRNATVPNTQNTSILSTEISAKYSSSTMKLGASIYHYQQSNGSSIKNLYDDMLYAYVHYSIQKIATTRTGLELWGEFMIADPLWLNLVAIVQNNIYTNNPTGTAYKESTGKQLIDKEIILYKGQHIGGAPEKLGAIILSYQPYGWIIRLSTTIFEGQYEVLSPTRHTTRARSRAQTEHQMNAMTTQLQSKWGASIDLFGGHTLRFNNGQSLGFYGSINNLTCNPNIVTYSYQSDRFVRNGWALTPQASRLSYTLPLNFFLNITYRF